MQLFCRFIVCIFLFSCADDSFNTESDLKNSSIKIADGELININDKNHIREQYVINYNLGDSLLRLYYSSLVDRIVLKENVISASEHFQKSLIYASDSTSSLAKIAECYIILEQYKQSIALLNNYYNGNDCTIYLLMARSYKGLGNHDRSVNICDSLIFSDTISIPVIIEASLLIANILAEDFDKKAIHYYDQVLEINDDHIPALYGKGLFYQNHQMYSEAVDLYHRIKIVDAFNVNANFNLGFIFMELSDYNNAINYFTDVIVSEKDYYKAYFARGICYEKKGNIVHAEKDYNKALEIYPNYLDAQQRLDKLLLANKKYY